MKEFYKKILDNNKKWVEESLELDPNYFEDLAKGQTPPLLWIEFLQMKSLAQSRERYSYIEILPIW